MTDMKIGEIRELDGKKYKAVESDPILGCYPCDRIGCCSWDLGHCTITYREDGRSVVFKEVTDD